MSYNYKYKFRECVSCKTKCCGKRCWKCYSKDRFSTLSRAYSKGRYNLKNNKVKESMFSV